MSNPTKADLAAEVKRLKGVSDDWFRRHNERKAEATKPRTELASVRDRYDTIRHDRNRASERIQTLQDDVDWERAGTEAVKKELSEAHRAIALGVIARIAKGEQP